MKQITIRGIPAEIKKAVKKEAEKKGISINKAFISLVEKGTGIKASDNKKPPYHDLDRFFGILSEKEASLLDKNLKNQRKIDKHLWKAAK